MSNLEAERKHRGKFFGFSEERRKEAESILDPFGWEMRREVGQRLSARSVWGKWLKTVFLTLAPETLSASDPKSVILNSF